MANTISAAQNISQASPNSDLGGAFTVTFHIDPLFLDYFVQAYDGITGKIYPVTSGIPNFISGLDGTVSWPAPGFTMPSGTPFAVVFKLGTVNPTSATGSILAQTGEYIIYPPGYGFTVVPNSQIQLAAVAIGGVGVVSVIGLAYKMSRRGKRRR